MASHGGGVSPNSRRSSKGGVMRKRWLLLLVVFFAFELVILPGGHSFAEHSDTEAILGEPSYTERGEAPDEHHPYNYDQYDDIVLNISTKDKKALIQSVNKARRNGRSCGSKYYGPASPIRWNKKLEKAAQHHSNDMAFNDFFDHTGSDGSQPWDRVTDAGYSWSTVGENIAAGYSTPAAVMNGWLGSPGHCANIMNPAFKQMGVAYTIDEGSEYRIYWTQVFAAH